MLKVKGPLFKSTLKFIKKQLGEDGYADFQSRLPAECGEFLSKPILSSTFYPPDMLIQITDTFIEMQDMNPETAYMEMGRNSADEGFSGVYRIFLKVGSPLLMVRQAPLLWRAYYNQGRFEVPESSKRAAVLRIVNSGIHHVCLCSRISGFIERTMELSGGRHVHFHHTKCFATGDEVEEWNVDWA